MSLLEIIVLFAALGGSAMILALWIEQVEKRVKKLEDRK
jgi:predicted outer membrane lipoprotein